MRQAFALLTGGAPAAHASGRNTHDGLICDSACTDERSQHHVSPGMSAVPHTVPSVQAQTVRQDAAGALRPPLRPLCWESWQHQHQVRPSLPPRWRISRPGRPCRGWARQRSLPGAARPPPRLPRRASAPRQSSSLGGWALPLHRANSSPSCSAVICCPAHRAPTLIRLGLHNSQGHRLADPSTCSTSRMIVYKLLRNSQWILDENKPLLDGTQQAEQRQQHCYVQWQTSTWGGGGRSAKDILRLHICQEARAEVGAREVGCWGEVAAAAALE